MSVRCLWRLVTTRGYVWNDVMSPASNGEGRQKQVFISIDNFNIEYSTAFQNPVAPPVHRHTNTSIHRLPCVHEGFTRLNPPGQRSPQLTSLSTYYFFFLNANFVCWLLHSEDLCTLLNNALSKSVTGPPAVATNIDFSGGRGLWPIRELPYLVLTLKRA